MVCNLKGLFLLLIIALLGIYNISGVIYFEDYSGKGKNRIVSVAGGRAEIPCVSNPRKTGDNPILILWYKESFSKPIYSFDARSTSLSNGERWANDTLFGERAYFVPLAKPHALLIVEPIKASDEGEYFCRLDYEDSPTTTSAVNLTVVVYPSPPEIFWNNQLVTGPIGPMHEGTYWRLVCVTKGGKPSPVVTWWREGHQVLSEVQKTEKDETKAILTVIAARNLSMNTFSCHAQVLFEGSPVDQPLVASIIFRIVLPPIAIMISGGDRPVAADTTLSLRCTTWGSYPPAEVIWWQSGKKFNPFVQSISEGGNSSTAEIKLTVKDVDHGTAFTCRATNPKYNVPPMEKSIILNVTYKPVVSLRVKIASELLSKTGNSSFLERSVVVKQGTHIRLECPVRSNPSPEFIEWIQNGVTIDSGKTAFSLLLENTVRGNSGIYTCAATNEGGVGLSQPFSIMVEYAPICAKGWQKRTQGSETYHPVTVLCRVDALPSDDLTFYWSKLNNLNEEFRFNIEQIQTDGTTSRLMFIPQNRSDYGQLLCRAKNSAGMQHEPCQVTLVPSSRPDPPFNCSAEYGGVPGSLLISCLEGFNGGFTQKFTLIAVQRGRLTANITRDFSEWIIHNLEIGKSVTLRIEAFNARGISDAVRLELVVPVPQIMSDQDVHQLEDLSHKTRRVELPLIGILVGGGGVLAISLLVVCIYLILMKNQKPPQKPILKLKKRLSVKKTNSTASNCSQQDTGYDILPLNRMKKVSDPDVVICIKKENSRRSPSTKGIDIDPPQSQMEPLIVHRSDLLNADILETNSGNGLNESSCCEHLKDQLSQRTENQSSECGTQNTENIDEERGANYSKSHRRNRSLRKRPCCEDYSDPISNLVTPKSTKAICRLQMERRSSAPAINNGTYDFGFGKGFLYRKRCIECDKCCQCGDSQSYWYENNKITLSSSLEPCLLESRIANVEKNDNFIEKQHGILKSVSIDEVSRKNVALVVNTSLHHTPNRIKSLNNVNQDNIYEETSNFLFNKANSKEKSTTTSGKTKIWYRNLGGLLCPSMNNRCSNKVVENSKLNSRIAYPDQSSTYQKFDEFSSTYTVDKLEKISPKVNKKIKLPTEKEKKSTERKSEFEDILYISKAELDILLNIDDNIKERTFLEDVSSYQEILQQKRDLRMSNTNFKSGYYAHGNDGSKLRRKRNKTMKDKTERKADKYGRREFPVTSSENRQSSPDFEERNQGAQCLGITESNISDSNLQNLRIGQSNFVDLADPLNSVNQNSNLENLRNGFLLENSEVKCVVNDDSRSNNSHLINNTESKSMKEKDSTVNIKLRSPKIKNSKMKRRNVSAGIFKPLKGLNESTTIVSIKNEQNSCDEEPQCESISRRTSITGTLAEDRAVTNLTEETDRRIELDLYSDFERNKQPLRSILRHN